MSATPRATKRVVIQEDIPEQAVSGLAEFIDRYYITPNLSSAGNSSYTKTESRGTFEFIWKLKFSERNESGSETDGILSVKLQISQTVVELEFADLDLNNRAQMSLFYRATDDIQNITWSYIQHAKMSSIYFVIGANEEEHAEAPKHGKNTQRSVLRRIFAGNTTNMFLFFMLLSFLLFFIIGIYTVFVLIGLQLVALFYSDRIILSLGNVRPTADRPYVTVLSVRSTPEALKSLAAQGKKMLSQIREEVSKTVVVPVRMAANTDAKSMVLEILSEHGIKVSVNDVEIKSRDVYGIVQRVSKKFNRPIPKITIVNSLISNASATGISSKRSSIMITAGSLEDLNDGELESVIGHEFGHIKGHDPVILYAVTSFELFGRFYLWLPLLLYLGLFYFVLAFGVIFLVGKFLETRADTESAVVLGNADAMASSLKKIGFRQLYHEKYSSGAKLFDWFQLDPHPPIYFRIMRLSRFSGKAGTIRHTLLVSIRDCVVGFFSALFSF